MPRSDYCKHKSRADIISVNIYISFSETVRPKCFKCFIHFYFIASFRLFLHFQQNQKLSTAFRSLHLKCFKFLCSTNYSTYRIKTLWVLSIKQLLNCATFSRQKIAYNEKIMHNSARMLVVVSNRKTIYFYFAIKSFRIKSNEFWCYTIQSKI